MTNFEQISSASDNSHLATYARFPVALTSGHGAVLTGSDGKEYLDFGSGIGVSSIGQTDPDWVAAIQQQAQTLAHISNLYYNDQQAAFSQELCAAAEMERVFLCNSGAEANECAIKAARKYSFDKYGENRGTVISLKNSFHGRTITTITATGQENFHQYFFPFPGGFAYAEPGDIDALRSTDDGTVCAVIAECIQGEGGVVPLEAEYLGAVRMLCDEKDWLLIIDEVQTGAGRTGAFLACKPMGVLPDMVTMAKGLGGGLPIGACLMNAKTAGVLDSGTHGSTFGGNPIVCAGARIVLKKLCAPGFMDDVLCKGYRLRSGLSLLPGVKEVRGRGLMAGIVLDDGIAARDVASFCLDAGLLVLTAKTLVRLLPPLTITEREIDKGLAILESVLKNITKEPVVE